MKFKARLVSSLLATSLMIGGNVWADKTILNVSYDPTRELYQEFNGAFAKYWEQKAKEEDNHQAISWRFRQTGALGNRRS